MRTRRRRLGELAVFVALLLPGTTASTAGTGSRQQPCGVASVLPSPPPSRPHYVLSVHVLQGLQAAQGRDRKSTRLNSSHVALSYAVFCLKKKKKNIKKDVGNSKEKEHTRRV